MKTQTTKKTGKRTRRKSNKNSYVGVVAVLIVLVVLAGILSVVFRSFMPSKEKADLNALYGITGEDRIGVSVDGLISSEPALVRDGKYYLSMSLVEDRVNEALWFDEAEQLMCVTTPTQFTTFTKEEMLASGAMLDGETMYLSMDFISQWSDVEIAYYEDPARMMIRTTWPYEVIQVDKKTYIREKATKRAPYLAEVAAGESLLLISECEGQAEMEGWYYVATTDGRSGYVQTDCLGDRWMEGDDHVSTIGEYTSVTLPGKVNMVFYQTDNESMNATLSEKLANGVSGINAICPTWFFMDGPGTARSICDASFVETCHNQGYQVWALLNDIDGNCTSSSDVTEALRRNTDRRRLVDFLMQEITSYGIDGLNIDLEHVSEEGAPFYREFIRELSVECRNRGLCLSVDNYVPMDYSLYLDRGAISKVVDYMIVMCYDEHYYGSDEAGSVASISFLKRGIERTMREVPREKIVAALPFYTR
ncbi:MAG: hypothetical protein KBS83_06345, partial [Lachnospiraceae bacterium]|nr:hypothetical protein [Candidatus Equihabitans merdae]